MPGAFAPCHHGHSPRPNMCYSSLNFSDWFDYYEGSKETKIQEMQQDILEYINNFSSQKFEIIEKPVFTLFGKGFLKYKELVFE